MTELADQTLGELRLTVEARRASCREVVEACLDRAAAVDQRLRAFVTLRREEALREAEQADAARSRGDAHGH